MSDSKKKNTPEPLTATSNFLRTIIQNDIHKQTYTGRKWLGKPSLINQNISNDNLIEHYPLRFRFPPEPNGYLHIGHAKSICLNFGLARDFGGVCHLRFDDTNPEKESIEFEQSIINAVNWLGFSYGTTDSPHQYLYYASDYFDAMYECAVYLIKQGLAYVDEQSAETIQRTRGDFSTIGTDSPFRNRSIEENLNRFEAMKSGELIDGAAVLRAKIDMASPNINLRDPAIYRIRHTVHHRSERIGAWCIYPMYTFAHPIEDALENITHSICTLEFEDQRPFYDWLLGHLSMGGLINQATPKQYEFARLNLTYVVTSKRKLAQLVNEGHVNGWDDPRLPTLAGLRRRGYTPESLKLFCERIGVTKSNSWIDYSILEGALRDGLDTTAGRAMAVLNPIRLVIRNFEDNHIEPCVAPVHPHDESRGQRQFGLSRELWIEADDFQAIPEKGYHRLYPPFIQDDGTQILGNRVRLKYGFVIECTGFECNDQGKVTTVYANYFPDSKSGTPTSGNYKVKGVITWVSTHDALSAQVRLYDRLFNTEHPDMGEHPFLTYINPNALSTVTAYLEPTLSQAQPEQAFQFERLGYFVADQYDHNPNTHTLVFNRSVSLKDNWKV